MTNERDKEDMDTRVSETYRELSAPRVPDHLNQAILAMAANKGPGKGNFLLAAWVKPVTLAATVALSLAIVLELTEVTTSPVQLEVVPETDSPSRAEGRARSQLQRNPMPVREDESISADGDFIEELVLRDTDLAKSEAKSKNDSFAASPAADPPAARKRAADGPVTNQPAAMSLESDQAIAERLIEAEPVGSIAVTGARFESSVATGCDDKARQAADTWLDCIDNLRESGLAQDADREYDAFVLKYPAEAARLESNR